jgi:SAM-dependent methyltransferase
MTDSEIFDRALRRIRRDRAAYDAREEPRHLKYVAADILDRLATLPGQFETALVMNGAAATLIDGLRARGIDVDVADPGMIYAQGGRQFDEDLPRLSGRSYSLIVSVGLVDTINDLPGALLLCRRTLSPGGLFLAQCVGVGTGERLRTSLRQIDPHVQRCHPMIDVRAAGDLLVRAGFRQPVAESETYRLNFASLADLIRDVRAHAASNLLRDRHPLSRAHYMTLLERLSGNAPIQETLTLIALSGWAAESE